MGKVGAGNVSIGLLDIRGGGEFCMGAMDSHEQGWFWDVAVYNPSCSLAGVARIQHARGLRTGKGEGVGGVGEEIQTPGILGEVATREKS